MPSPPSSDATSKRRRHGVRVPARWNRDGELLGDLTVPPAGATLLVNGLGCLGGRIGNTFYGGKWGPYAVHDPAGGLGSSHRASRLPSRSPRIRSWGASPAWDDGAEWGRPCRRR